MRDGPHDRARRGHAPCKPRRGDHRGCKRRVGRATRGATRQAPPPCRGTSAPLVPALCLRRAYARGQTARTPPPQPLLPQPPRKGARTARRRRGDMGGGQRTDQNAGGRDGRRVVKTPGSRSPKKKTKQANAPQQGQTAETDGTRQELGARQGAREWGTPLGKKAGRQGPTPQRTGRGRGDNSPQETLVRYPTSGVWPPPPCPYWPHLSAGNKVGYARDRWPAARGGTGQGGGQWA